MDLNMFGYVLSVKLLVCGDPPIFLILEQLKQDQSVQSSSYLFFLFSMQLGPLGGGGGGT